MAKKQDETKQPAKLPTEELAFRICARTGMGLSVCRERMAGNESQLEALLEAGDIGSVLALLEPANKA